MLNRRKRRAEVEEDRTRTGLRQRHSGHYGVQLNHVGEHRAAMKKAALDERDERGNGGLEDDTDHICKDAIVSVGDVQRPDRIRIVDQGTVFQVINRFLREEEEKAVVEKIVLLCHALCTIISHHSKKRIAEDIST